MVARGPAYGAKRKREERNGNVLFLSNENQNEDKQVRQRR